MKSLNRLIIILLVSMAVLTLALCCECDCNIDIDQSYNHYGKECATPQGRPGFCVSLLKCKSLLNLLSDVKENPSDREYLRKSRCDDSRSSDNVRVCCPKSDLRSDLEYKADNLLPFRDVCGQQSIQSPSTEALTKLNEFPWTVQLWYTYTPSINSNETRAITICAGTLINANHVITAAHCVHPIYLYKRAYKLDKVRLGEWSTSVEVDCDGSFCADPVKDVSIAEVIIHEKFNYKLFFTGNNIAVIRLAEKVRYSNFIRPICLPLAHLENKKFIGNDLLLVHWKSSTNEILGNVKSKIPFIGSENENCESVFSKLNATIAPSHLCAVSLNHADSCSGEGGAPLIGLDKSNPFNKFWYIAGIVSFVPKPCEQDKYTIIFSRINSFTDWIISKIQ